MGKSVQFYHDVLGLEVLYGDSKADFTSLRIPNTELVYQPATGQLDR